MEKKANVKNYLKISVRACALLYISDMVEWVPWRHPHASERPEISPDRLPLGQQALLHGRCVSCSLRRHIFTLGDCSTREHCNTQWSTTYLSLMRSKGDGLPFSRDNYWTWVYCKTLGRYCKPVLESEMRRHSAELVRHLLEHFPIHSNQFLRSSTYIEQSARNIFTYIKMPPSMRKQTASAKKKEKIKSRKKAIVHLTVLTFQYFFS